MDLLGGGLGGRWGCHFRLPNAINSRNKRRGCQSNSSKSVEATGGSGFHFPLKESLTAGSLSFSGDTIAQVIRRWRKGKASDPSSLSDLHSLTEGGLWNILSEHDWIRGLRMASYGFLLYGPGSYAWYQYLDYALPKKSWENLMLKVLLNQIILGPCVIAVVFAWNNLWLGKASQLPEMYRKDALPTLLYGFRFWIPVTVLNFGVVPLQARVAFMSMASVFWNFILSSTMSK